MNLLFLVVSLLASIQNTDKTHHLTHVFKHETDKDLKDIFIASFLNYVLEKTLLNIEEIFNNYYKQYFLENNFEEIIKNTKKLLINVITKVNDENSTAKEYQSILTNLNSIKYKILSNEVLKDYQLLCEEVKNQEFTIKILEKFIVKTICFFVDTYMIEILNIKKFSYKHILFVSGLDRVYYSSVRNDKDYILSSKDKFERVGNEKILFFNSTLFEYAFGNFIRILSNKKMQLQFAHDHISKLIRAVLKILSGENMQDKEVFKIFEFRMNLKKFINTNKKKFLATYDEFYFSKIRDETLCATVQLWLEKNLDLNTKDIEAFKLLFVKLYNTLFYNTIDILNQELIRKNTHEDMFSDQNLVYVYRT